MTARGTELPALQRQDLDAAIAFARNVKPAVATLASSPDLAWDAPLGPRPTRGVIMLPFLRRSRYASRFSDGSFGVYYAGESLSTAIAESAYHRGIFLRAAASPPIQVRLLGYSATVAHHMHDIRGARGRYVDVYSPTSYVASQDFGRLLVAHGSDGVAYDSVRRTTGQCVGAFNPDVVGSPILATRVICEWDGARIARAYRLRS